MKLLNRSLIYLSITFLFIIGIWSVIFYYNLKDEIRDSIDDGLDNNKLLIIQKAKTDSTLLNQAQFGGNNFEIHSISKDYALQIKDVFKDTLMYRINENDLEPVRILHSAFEYKNQFYKIKVISSLVEEDDLIEDSFWSVVWLFLILICSIILINNVVLRKVWNPFYDILGRLKAYRLDKDETPINITTKTKEFVELQDASNALIKHSKEAYGSQKQFTENASHELQTPLAIIRNKLELLLESEDLNNNDAQSIVEVISMAERLTQLNKSLLLLAKIENKQFPNHKRLSLNRIAKEIIANYQDFIDYKEIVLTVEEKENLEINMDPSLAEILLSNLIKNAVFHNIKDGQIHLRFTKDEILIRNTGIDKALHPEKIFNRFHKDASKDQSTGLGLAVCKAICKQYEILLSYSFDDGKHCFKLNFKNLIIRA